MKEEKEEEGIRTQRRVKKKKGKKEGINQDKGVQEAGRPTQGSFSLYRSAFVLKEGVSSN